MFKCTVLIGNKASGKEKIHFLNVNRLNQPITFECYHVNRAIYNENAPIYVTLFLN